MRAILKIMEHRNGFQLTAINKNINVLVRIIKVYSRIIAMGYFTI